MRKLILILLFPCILLAQNARYTKVKVDSVDGSNNGNTFFKDTVKLNVRLDSSYAHRDAAYFTKAQTWQQRQTFNQAILGDTISPSGILNTNGLVIQSLSSIAPNILTIRRNRGSPTPASQINVNFQLNPSSGWTTIAQFQTRLVDTSAAHKRTIFDINTYVRASDSTSTFQTVRFDSSAQLKLGTSVTSNAPGGFVGDYAKLDSVFSMTSSGNVWYGSPIKFLRGAEATFSDSLNVNNLNMSQLSYLVKGTNSSILGGTNNFLKMPIAGRGSSSIMGDNDTINVTNALGGEAHVFGNNNLIEDTYGGYGVWLYGEYLHTNTKGVWAFGADNSQTKMTIPFSDAIVFNAERIINWANNGIPLNSLDALSTAYQSPSVADSVRYTQNYQQRGSATKANAYASFDFMSQRNFHTNALTGNMDASLYHTYLSFNYDSLQGIVFNPIGTDTAARPFGSVKIANGNFIVSNGTGSISGATTLGGLTVNANAAQNIALNDTTTVTGTLTVSGNAAFNSGAVVLNKTGGGEVDLIFRQNNVTRWFWFKGATNQSFTLARANYQGTFQNNTLLIDTTDAGTWAGSLAIKPNVISPFKDLFNVKTSNAVQVFDADSLTQIGQGTVPVAGTMYTRKNIGSLGFFEKDLGLAGDTKKSVDSVGNAVFAGSLQIGGGTAILKMLTGSRVYDCGAIAAVKDSIFTITVTGAAVQSSISVNESVAPDPGTIVTAYCASAGTVTVMIDNITAGSINPASKTYYVTVINW